jgi:hypothetical protein
LAGCAAWTAGALWAPESAFYCCAVWLPAYAVLIWRRTFAAVPAESTRRRRLGEFVALAALPPIMLGAAVGAVDLWYLRGLGHLPDWPRYLDCARSFTVNGYVLDRPHSPDGVIWVLVLAFCALSAFAVATLARRSSCATIALAAGLWGLLWAASSYYVLRVEELFLLNLSPIVCMCAAAALKVMARGPIFGRVAGPVRASLIPILVVLLTMSWGNDERMKDWAHALRRGYVRSVDRLMATMDPELVRLLARAQVRAEEPIVYLEAGRPWTLAPLPLWPEPERGKRRHAHWRNRAWMPSMPFVLFVTIPQDKRALYMHRFADRTQLGGWLIESKKTSTRTDFPWFFEIVSDTHRATTSIEETNWRLTRFEPRAAQVARQQGTNTRR